MRGTAGGTRPDTLAAGSGATASLPTPPEAQTAMHPATAIDSSGVREDTQPSHGPVRVGVLAPFSGRYATHGRAYLDGVQLAMDAFNASGPLQVASVPADSKGEPLEALLAVRGLIDQEGVWVVLGDLLNATTWVAAVEANSRLVPLVSNVATDEGIGKIGPYVFHSTSSERRAAREAAELAVLELRLFRAAVLYEDEDEGRILANLFSVRVGELGGRIVAAESFAAGTKDYTSAVRRVREAHPEVIYLPVGRSALALLVPTLGYEGVDAQLVGTQAWNSESLLGSTSLDLEGALVPASTAETADALPAAAAAAYKAKRGAKPNPFVVAGYLAARRALDGLAGAGDREALRAALATRAAADRPQAFRFLVVRNGKLVPFMAP